MFERYICVLQKDEKDCGPACILTILKEYNINYSIAKLREIVGTDTFGTNIYGLIKGLEYFGFKGTAVRVEDKRIDNSLNFPIIAHLNINGLYHYVVIQNIKKKELIISDPSKGVVKVSFEDFYKNWIGILIIVEKTENIRKINENSTYLSKLFSILKSDKNLIFNIILISIIYTFLGLISSFYFKALVDYILVDKLINTLNIIMIGVIFVTIIKYIFDFIRNQLVLYLSQKIDHLILFGYYKHVLNLPLKFFSTRKVGEIVSRFSDGVNIRQVIADIIFTSTIDLFISIFTSVILFYLNKYLFFISIFIILIYTVIIYSFKKIIKDKNEQVLENNAILTSNIIENLKGIETIKAYNLELEMEQETEYKFFNFLRSSYERGVIYNIITFLSLIVSDLGNFFIIWIGAIEVIKENITLGKLLVFVGILVYFLEPIKKIINLQTQIQIAIVASDRIGEIVELDVENKEEDKSQLINLKGNINIENLKFRYGTRGYVLNNISMTIRSGQKIAFVGESGSGKTTLAKLLLKYYSFEQGSIKINGYNIDDIGVSFLRNKISYVSQETFLFSKSIKDNLFLNVNSDMKEILHLCEKLKLTDFINSLPKKFDSIIDENGANLSGGQKQRLSILRALLKHPDILILDEATSNLDSITEKAIQETIMELGITVIIIAHRLSTIKNCDKIFVFDKGEIVESGNHEKLLKNNGIYSTYWRDQL